MTTSDPHGAGRRPRIGLVLPGGGARGAYQVGVLKAISEFVPDGESPFQVIIGTSVGAVNATSLASHAQDFRPGVASLARLWSRLRTHDIYRTDIATISLGALQWLLALTLGGIGIANPRSLLDNAPLEGLLRRELHFSRIADAIEAGKLRAVAVSASSHTTSRAVTFFQGAEDLEEWQRARRDGIRETLATHHVMASAALPFIFPARRINAEYFFDGSLRLNAPLSPAIRLGAERILIIGVRDERRDAVPEADAELSYPSLGEIAGSLLDVLFMDNLNADIERLERVNHTLSLMTPDEARETNLRPVGIHVIRPSQDIREIAGRHVGRMPRTIRMLLRGVGAWKAGWQLPSYLLFEPPYCNELMELGYRDAMADQESLAEFLGLSHMAPTP